jgi:probable blue pigment (indigoidine) exporter
VAVFFRMWLSVPLLVLWTRATGHRIDRVLLRRTAVAGCVFGVNLCFVFTTFHHATIATLSVLSALQPGLILLVAGRLLGERPTRWHVGWTVVGIAGAVLVVLGAGSAVRSSPLGVALAAGSLLTFTGYFVISKLVRARQPVDAVEWMAGVTIFAALTVTPLALVSASRSDFAQVGGNDWLWLGFAVIVTGILGHVLMAWAHRFIDASRSSLYVLSMNVVAVAAAWPIHHEPLTVVQLAGGAVVLGSVGAVVSRPPRRVPPALALGGSPPPTAEGAGLGASAGR